MTTETTSELIELLAEVSDRLIATVLSMDPADWERPGLGEWTVRELVGHTLRAFSTVDRFLDSPLDEVAVDSSSEYYSVALGTLPGVHEQVAQRGREAGEQLGDDPVAAVVEQVSETLGRLGSAEGDEVGVTAVGGMALADYLETRLVELVVHLSDLLVALGRQPEDLGSAGQRAAATILASASPADRDAVLRAMLGRGELPPGFTVWP